MKKYLLPFLILIFSCSDENQKSTNESIQGKWIQIGYTLNDTISGGSFKNFDFLDNKKLNYQTIIKFENDSIFDGSYKYNFRTKQLKEEYFDDFTSTYVNGSKTVFTEKWYYENYENITTTLEIKSFDKDTLIIQVIKSDSLGKDILGKNVINRYYKRIPLYSSQEARELLKQKKEDLDLQLISQEEYDEIKESLSKYILDK